MISQTYRYAYPRFLVFSCESYGPHIMTFERVDPLIGHLWGRDISRLTIFASGVRVNIDDAGGDVLKIREKLTNG